jgi:hypothetical protein
VKRIPSTGDDFIDALRLYSPGFDPSEDNAGHMLINRAATMRSEAWWWAIPTDMSRPEPVSGEMEWR